MNPSKTPVDSARTKLDAAESLYSELLTTVQKRVASLPDTASAADVDAIENEYRSKLDAAEADVTSARRQLDTARSIADARSQLGGLIPAGDVRVSEPDIYTENGANSYIGDLYRSQYRNDRDASARLNRHWDERKRNASAETRAAFANTSFYPPQWAESLWVETKRQRRVVAELVTQLQLPPAGNTLEIPAYNEAPATAADVQNGDGGNVVSNAPSGANVLTVPVITLAGFLDIPRQMVERGLPGLDVVVFSDIYKDVNRHLDSYLIYGNGGSGQPKGITSVSGTNSVTISSLTVANFYTAIANAVTAIQTGAYEAPDGIVMHPRRIGWLLSQVDSDGRPLMVPNASGPYNALGVLTSGDGPMGQSDSNQSQVRPAGWLMGIPVYPDANIATTLGSGTNADEIIVGAFKEAILWEAGTPREFTFEGVSSAQLNLRLQVVHYAAFTAERYPTAFSIVTGNSLTNPFS